MTRFSLFIFVLAAKSFNAFIRSSCIGITRPDLPFDAQFGRLIVEAILPFESQTIFHVNNAISFARKPALKLSRKMTLFRVG